jgi:ketosteroid isomerase-like protein
MNINSYKMKEPLIFLFTCVILTGCNRSSVVDKRVEEEAINKIEDQWTEAIKAKDNEKILSFFAPEAIIMNANMPACIGLAGIRRSQESWFSDTTIIHNSFTSAIDTIEVSASGDLAYVRGNNKISIITPNGIVEETDKWITIYRKIDMDWKAIVDIWNSDMPVSKEQSDKSLAFN